MLLLAWEGNFVVLSKTSHLRSPQVPLVRARDHQIPCVHPWSRPVRTSDNGYKMVQVHSDSLTWKWKMASWKTTFLYKQWVFHFHVSESECSFFGGGHVPFSKYQSGPGSFRMPS